MMVNPRSESADVDDSGSSLPCDPAQDDGLPAHPSPREDEEEEEEEEHDRPSPVGSEIWMPMDDNSRKGMQAMFMYRSGMRPTDILQQLFPNVALPLAGMTFSDSLAIRMLSDLVERPPKRNKLTQYNSFEDAVELFRNAKRILILTGAGVSVSCGIPDFRSKDGIYARLHELFPDLPDPSAMFDIDYFRRNPKPFYDFAKDIFPGMFEPSFSHKLIAQLERRGKLLRNYTQNIDTLEQVAGIQNVIECHGSFSSATCLACKEKYTPDDIRENVLQKRVAFCPKCTTGVIKPDIVFFGEDLHENFHQQMAIDKDQPDLLIVIGSSLKVRPVSLIPFAVPVGCPQILINRESIPHYTPDIELLGNCDDILREIALAMGEEEFVEEYDRTHAKNADKTRKRRRKISTAEFQTIFAKLDEEQTEKMERVEREDEERKTEEDKQEKTNGEEEENEPGPAKRMKMDMNKQLKDMQDLFTMRYISVESHLPEGAYFEASTNQHVFPGAEIYMDMDSKMLCQPPRRRHVVSSSSGEDNDESCDEEEEGETRDCPSEPYSEPCPSAPSPPSDPRGRASSCAPSMDTESLLTPDELRSALENYHEEEGNEEEEEVDHDGEDEEISAIHSDNHDV